MNGKVLLNAASRFFWPVFLVTCANAQVPKTFPEGPGKQVVEQVCLQCHESAFLLRQRHTENDWKKIVARMSKKGPSGPTASYDTVAAYMFSNFGKTGPDMPDPPPLTEEAGGRGGRGGRGRGGAAAGGAAAGGAAAGGAAAGGRGGGRGGPATGGPPAGVAVADGALAGGRGGRGGAAAGGADTATINDFPDGPGKEFVQQICMQCHAAGFLFEQRHTEDYWVKTVARMSKKGLGGPIESYDAVAAYMAKNFGASLSAEKVNVNTATVDDFVTKLGLTKEEATALVGYRTKNGDFHEWGELLVIYGLDGKKIAAEKDKLNF